MAQFGASLIAQLNAIKDIPSVPALQAGADVYFKEMQLLTPVDKGELKESEEVKVENDTVLLYAGTDHALPVEFGTVHMAAQSFMRAALDNKKNEAEKAIADAVQEEIRKAING